MSIIFSILFLIAVPFQLEAKPFANNFLEFNAPDSWGCAESGENWTCQPLDPKKTKDAVIVMAAGSQGPGDTMQEYFTFLNSSLFVYDPSAGTKAKSTPSYTQYKDIFGQKWVDSQHLSTAVPGYYTRYLATVKDGRAVLFTVTVEKSKYNIYMSELYKLIESMKMRMFFPAEPVDTGLKGLLFGQKTTINNAVKKDKKMMTFTGAKGSSAGLVIAIIVAVVVFVAAYIIIKRRRKRGRDKEKNKGFFKK